MPASLPGLQFQRAISIMTYLGVQMQSIPMPGGCQPINEPMQAMRSEVILWLTPR